MLRYVIMSVDTDATYATNSNKIKSSMCESDQTKNQLDFNLSFRCYTYRRQKNESLWQMA